jgi:hypothetical protein
MDSFLNRREEWCGIYQKSLVFFAPLTDQASLELSFEDIQTIRPLEADSRSPLPGYPLLALETAWICYYVAFSDAHSRNTFRVQIEEAMVDFEQSRDSVSDISDKELVQARFWQGFQSTVNASLSGGNEKWAEVASGKSTKNRLILNNRRMTFDLDPLDEDPCEFVEDLLRTSLSFTLQHLTEHPEALVRFLVRGKTILSCRRATNEFSSYYSGSFQSTATISPPRFGY